ncbi:hypothetical protein RIF29_34624 [Crotalaria pallida]|uniref:Uncharacterized protein n=1 Tax=Crotalaria pallida TaxID=3830 RepID=A0AAN9EF03_CROPI
MLPRCFSSSTHVKHSLTAIFYSSFFNFFFSHSHHLSHHLLLLLLQLQSQPSSTPHSSTSSSSLTINIKQGNRFFALFFLGNPDALMLSQPTLKTKPMNRIGRSIVLNWREN